MRTLSFGRKPRTQRFLIALGFFFLTHLNVILHRQVGRLIARPKQNMPPKWLLMRHRSERSSSSFIIATNQRKEKTINEEVGFFH